MTATIGVIAVAGADHMRRCLEQLVPQTRGLPLDVMVPYDASLPGIGELRAAFPEVAFVDLGLLTTSESDDSVVARHERFEKRVSAVLSRARGSHVALLQDWSPPEPDWCSRLLAATTRSHAAVGGAIDNAASGTLQWAAYFLDFGRYQSPLPDGPSRSLSDMNIMYRRDDLEALRPLWQEQYNEMLVNWSLLERGKVLWRDPTLVVRHDRGGVTLDELVAERFGWGRVFGAIRALSLPRWRLVPYVVLSPLIPFVLVARAGATVLARRSNRLRYVQSLPAVFAFAVVWTLGELVGSVTRRPVRVIQPGRVQIAS